MCVCVCVCDGELCIYIYLSMSTPQAEAQAALDDLCSKLGSLGDECKTLVDSYFPQIWQMLINEAVCCIIAV